MINKTKDFLVSFFSAFGIGILVGLFARYAIFPVMAILHNRWFVLLSAETVDLIYFWTGQVVGSFVFIGYMYENLKNRKWSSIGSAIAVIISIFFLIVVGLVSVVVLRSIV